MISPKSARPAHAESADPVASPCGGGQMRSFSYDTLKRLSSAVNPEMGGNTLSYGYDENGNVLTKFGSGSPGLLVTYTYDSLNRVKTRDYSDGSTPPVTYCYDGKVWSGSFWRLRGIGSNAVEGAIDGSRFNNFTDVLRL